MSTAGPVRTIPLSSTELLGKRLLHEIEVEEESLESLLTALCQTVLPAPSRTNITSLDAIWSAHDKSQFGTPNSPLTLSGRALPLLYTIIASLVSSTLRSEPNPNTDPDSNYDHEPDLDLDPDNSNKRESRTPGLRKGEREGTERGATIILIDLLGTFSPSHLLSTNPSLQKSDLKHIHVFRPTPLNYHATLSSISNYMLYGPHSSYDREWKGVFVHGNPPHPHPPPLNTLSSRGPSTNQKSPGGDAKPPRIDIHTTHRGFLHITREPVPSFPPCTSVAEAWAERSRRDEVLDTKGWRAESRWGGFAFGRSDDQI